MIGLLERVIWVVPSWASTNRSSTGEIHERIQRHLGLTQARSKNGTLSNTLCACEFDHDLRKRVCMSVNQTDDSNSRDPEVKMADYRMCRPIRTYSLEIITASDFRDMQLTEMMIVNSDEKIILDIDEDYFGCSLPGEMLKQAAIPWSNIEIDESLAELLCPFRIQHEQLGADLIRDIITELTQLSSINKRSGVLTLPPKQFVALQKHVVNAWMKHPSMFCGSNDLHVRKAAETLLKTLLRFTKRQLEVLMQTGFCFSTSPVTLPFENVRLKLCRGNNDPDEPMVEIHVPEEVEVEESSYLLESLLQVIPSPSVITVCRSVRDGYTPRHLFKSIEDGLLDILRRLYSSGEYKYIYDENLWYGSLGIRTWQ